MAGRDRDNHRWLDLDRNARFRGSVQRLEHACLPDSVVAPEQRRRLAANCGAHVLELELVRVGPLDRDLVDLDRVGLGFSSEREAG